MPGDDPASIADQLAAQVRELLQGAEEQARQIMEVAEAEVARIRENAAEQGRRRIESARKALDDIEGRLGRAEPAGAPAPTKASSPEPPPPAAPPAPEPTPPAAPPEPEPKPPKPAPVSGLAGGDESAARLVAMKLALDGTSRDDVRSKLSAEYSVADLDGLLDDVFAKAGK
jgi:hypothetical protein